jgi:hypothetical protein
MDDSPYLLPHLPPGSGERGVSQSLRGGRGPNDPPARKLVDAPDIRHYGQLRTIIYTDVAQMWVELSGGYLSCSDLWQSRYPYILRC